MFYTGSSYVSGSIFGTSFLSVNPPQCSGLELSWSACLQPATTLAYNIGCQQVGVQCQGIRDLLQLILVLSLSLLTAVSVPCLEGTARLIGGKNHLEGTVEICFNQTWRAICDSGWGYAEAVVTCRQLGHSEIGEL